MILASIVLTCAYAIRKSFQNNTSVADPGFPVGAACTHEGGCGPPTRVLFTENVCKNERIGSHRGGRAPGTPPLDPPMHMIIITLILMIYYVEINQGTFGRLPAVNTSLLN